MKLKKADHIGALGVGIVFTPADYKEGRNGYIIYIYIIYIQYIQSNLT